MLTQEAVVHWMYGAFLALAGIVALAVERTDHPSRVARWALPVLFIVASVLLFLDPWVFHGYRGGISGAAAQVENVQHWQLAAMLLLVGALEALRVGGKIAPTLAGWGWLVALPAAALLYVHRQAGMGAEEALVLLQHRLAAVTLIAVGTSGVLAGYRPRPWLHGAERGGPGACGTLARLH